MLFRERPYFLGIGIRKVKTNENQLHTTAVVFLYQLLKIRQFRQAGFAESSPEIKDHGPVGFADRAFQVCEFPFRNLLRLATEEAEQKGYKQNAKKYFILHAIPTDLIIDCSMRCLIFDSHNAPPPLFV